MMTISGNYHARGGRAPRRLQSRAMTIIEPGSTYRVDCPFVRATIHKFFPDEGEVTEIETWNPGIRYDEVGPEDSEPVTDGWGYVIYKIVDTHKLPAPYHARAFFIRTFETPDGNVFGKRSLRVMTVRALRRRLQGPLVPGMLAPSRESAP